jgi:hypothetical protein
MNLFVSGTYPTGATSAVMNLFVGGGLPNASMSAPLFVQNIYQNASEDAPLFVAGAGGTPGATTASKSMNLFVQRGSYAGATLYVENLTVGISAPLFVTGGVTITKTAPLFVIGWGDTVTASATLVIPQVVQPTTATKQTTLVIPQVVGAATQSHTLYVCGWKP